MNASELIRIARQNKPELKFLQTITATNLMEVSPDQFALVVHIVSKADRSTGHIAMDLNRNCKPLQPDEMAGAITYIRSHEFDLPVVLIGPKNTIELLSGVRPIITDHAPSNLLRFMGDVDGWVLSFPQPDHHTEVQMTWNGVITDIAQIHNLGESVGHAMEFNVGTNGEISERFTLVDRTPSLGIVFVDSTPIQTRGPMDAINLYLSH